MELAITRLQLEINLAEMEHRNLVEAIEHRAKIEVIGKELCKKKRVSGSWSMNVRKVDYIQAERDLERSSTSIIRWNLEESFRPLTGWRTL